MIKTLLKRWGILKTTEAEFNLNEKAVLKFAKWEYPDTYVLFWYNPVFRCWWKLPDEDAAIHAKWFLYQEGSYGAYDLNVYEVDAPYIERVKDNFKTVGDVKNYFDKMNRRYDEWQNSKQEFSELPDTI